VTSTSVGWRFLGFMEVDSLSTEQVLLCAPLLRGSQKHLWACNWIGQCI